MSSSEEIIGHANPHTVKKFELIEKYVEAWAHILLLNQYCTGLVFIDCMSNSGEYVDDDGKQVFGTPVRVAKYLRQIAGQYYGKQIDLYFSDLSAAKTEHLESLMPGETRNFHCHITTEDGNELAKRIGNSMINGRHYLLVYDPFQATIDWNALFPFINNWCEIIINHMVSDSMRAIKMVKKDAARNKYEQTYLTELENLTPYGSDKTAYEKRIEEIIKALRRKTSRQYYIAAFPFFNEKNAIVYDLIHCTSNLKGFQLYKGKGVAKTHTDEFCFYIKDIAEYLQKSFNGQPDVPMSDVWALLDNHPIFPSDGFRPQIKNELKRNHGASVSRSTISFVDRS